MTVLAVSVSGAWCVAIVALVLAGIKERRAWGIERRTLLNLVLAGSTRDFERLQTASGAKLHPFPKKRQVIDLDVEDAPPKGTQPLGLGG